MELRSLVFRGGSQKKKKEIVLLLTSVFAHSCFRPNCYPMSPLLTSRVRAPAQSLLSNPAAWDVLDAVERTEILSLFPGGEHVLDARSADARPDILSLRNDDTFRHDCAAYTENVAEGRFDPGWLECAWSAHERRKMGDFDEHLAAKFEEDWQITLPNEYRPRREPSMGEAPAAASGAQARRDESMSEEAVSGHVNASNEHSPKGDDPERSTLHELGVSITASNGTYQSEYEFIEEVEEEQANERDQDDHHQTGEAMAVDELQVDEDVDMTTRPAPTPLARKLHRRTQTGEMDSEDELA